MRPCMIDCTANSILEVGGSCCPAYPVSCLDEDDPYLLCISVVYNLSKSVNLHPKPFRFTSEN